MEIVFFIYGLSFFILGVLLLFVKPKDSNLFFANKIWLLGLFAILHAFVEWIAMYQYVYPLSKDFLIEFEVLLLLLSYLSLFEFSRFIVRKSFENPHSKLHFIYHLYAGPVIYIISISSLLFLIMLYPGLNETIVAIRYTYGFWGSLFLGVGLYFYGEAIRKINHKEMLKLYFKISGIAFIAYAFFAGIVVPPVDHFPANVINSTWFLDTFHLPVQIFRSICAVIIAISSIKALEIFKLEVTEKLNESYQQIKEFNANASHQLKSPLSSMKVQIDVTLQKERDCKEYKTVLSSITEDIIHLQDMLHNLLLLTRMNDRSIKDSFKNVAVDTLLLNSIDKFMIISGKKKIALHVESLDSTNIQANPTLIEVLIDNLLDNAIKYTLENKNITIKLESNILTIKDEGIGIEKDKLPLIFNKFYQIDSRRKKGIYGYGLGLAMVKQISDLHNASIYITSVIHEGTTISVKF